MIPTVHSATAPGEWMVLASDGLVLQALARDLGGFFKGGPAMTNNMVIYMDITLYLTKTTYGYRNQMYKQ